MASEKQHCETNIQDILLPDSSALPDDHRTRLRRSRQFGHVNHYHHTVFFFYFQLFGSWSSRLQNLSYSPLALLHTSFHHYRRAGRSGAFKRSLPCRSPLPPPFRIRMQNAAVGLHECYMRSYLSRLFHPYSILVKLNDCRSRRCRSDTQAPSITKYRIHRNSCESRSPCGAYCRTLNHCLPS